MKCFRQRILNSRKKHFKRFQKKMVLPNVLLLSVSTASTIISSNSVVTERILMTRNYICWARIVFFFHNADILGSLKSLESLQIMCFDAMICFTKIMHFQVTVAVSHQQGFGRLCPQKMHFYHSCMCHDKLNAVSVYHFPMH